MSRTFSVTPKRCRSRRLAFFHSNLAEKDCGIWRRKNSDCEVSSTEKTLLFPLYFQSCLLKSRLVCVRRSLFSGLVPISCTEPLSLSHSSPGMGGMSWLVFFFTESSSIQAPSMEIATSSEGIKGSEMQSHYRANCRPNVKTKRGEKGGEEGRKGGFGSRPRSSLSHSEGFPSFLAQGLHFMPPCRGACCTVVQW